ncbi:MAG TPA: exodeoxyribonuclease VII small subunit [Alphaproteobacteria bacterium]|nr:exodeoxyribonuclease VII small subunit [Alphaproteobacteria bacterium]HAJ46303.1 exodeoxyribonuclease VII small subunit [Alphaproteobacteria bacterium]
MAKKDGADTIESLSFEAALKELEEIVGRLERGQVELEDSIRIYERGTALKAHCEAKLRNAEARVQKLLLGPNGPAGAEPLDVT